MAVSLAMIAAFGALDFATGADLNVAAFYILPIVTVTWVLGPRWTVPVAVVAAGTMLSVNYVADVDYASPLVPVWNAGSRLAVLLIVTWQFAYLRRTAKSAESLARTDALTGIGNVRYLRELAELEIARAQRYQHPFTVLFIDVDDFKGINDSFGHEAGDRTLRAIGQALAQHVRKTDLVARVGGDEFVVLLPMMSAEDAGSFLGMLRKRLVNQLADAPRPMTCSIGAVTFVTPPASVDEMLKAADERRYAAKQSGKDTVRHSVISRAPRDMAA